MKKDIEIIAGEYITLEGDGDYDKASQLIAAKGSRKLQLKNSMQAKFDKMVVPIARLVIDPEQQKHIRFDAFFENTMFHEVAHGLGVKYTLQGNQDVRGALKDNYTSIEEGKADILGLFCITKLAEWGVIQIKT